VNATPRVLLVGAGAMGARHARVIAQSGRATLATVVDPREDVGGGVAERFGAFWAPALGSLSGIDAVVIAAATEAHFELASRVIGEGIPVLVEKPMADGIEQTLSLIAAAERGSIPVMCGLLERFNPAIMTARELVDEPVHVTATRHSPYAPRIATGVSWDLLVHDVDLAVTFLGGEPTSVSGLLGRYDPRSLKGAEDVAEVVLRFSGGQVAHLSASRIGQRKVRSMSVHDVDKLVEIDLLRRDVTVYHNVSDQPANDDGRGYKYETVIEIPEIASSREPLASQFDHFVDLVTGVADADVERRSIVPSHHVIAEVKRQNS